MLERLIYSVLDNTFSEDPIVCVCLIVGNKELLMEKLQFISKQKWCLNNTQSTTQKTNKDKLKFNYRKYLLLTDFKLPNDVKLKDQRLTTLINTFAFLGNEEAHRNYWVGEYIPKIVSLMVIAQDDYHKATLYNTNQEHRFIYHCDNTEIENLRLNNYTRNHIKPIGEERLSYFYIQQLFTRKLRNYSKKTYPVLIQLQMPSNLYSHHKILLGYRDWVDDEIRQMALKSLQKPILRLLKLLVRNSNRKGEIPMNHFKDLEYADWFRIHFCEFFAYAEVNQETNIFSYKLATYARLYLEFLFGTPKTNPNSINSISSRGF